MVPARGRGGLRGGGRAAKLTRNPSQRYLDVSGLVSNLRMREAQGGETGGGVGLVLVAHFDGDFGDVRIGQRKPVLRPCIVRLTLQSGGRLGCETIERGTILREARRSHEMSLPRPGWAEFDAEAVWWDDVRALCGELAPFAGPSLRGVCVSGIGPCIQQRRMPFLSMMVVMVPVVTLRSVS